MPNPISTFLKHDTPDLKNLSREQWFDNSTIEAFLDCNRLAWYNYFHHFESKSAAMSAGTVWHAGLANLHQTKNLSQANVVMARAYEQHKAILQMGASRHAFGVLNTALVEYDKRYTNMPGIEMHEQELHFAVWIEASEWTLGFWLVGRLDGLLTYNNDFLILENKTTSQIGGSYLAGLDMSRQASTYSYAVNKLLSQNSYPGPRVRGVLFNVVKLGTKIEFLRHTVLRHEKALLEFEQETIRIVAAIRQSWASPEKPIKNTRSCNRYGECQFTDLCKAWTGQDKAKIPDLTRNFGISDWRPF